MGEAAQGGALHGGGFPAHWADRANALFAGGTKMFSGGFGKQELLSMIDGPPLYRPQAAMVAPAFEDARTVRGVLVRDGTFPSPVDLLPEESRTAHVRWLTADSSGPRRGSIVVLAGSRDAGYRQRTGVFGPLVQQGIDLYLLENPYYGLRRPAKQQGENLATAAEQALLIWGMVEEARGLLGWLWRQRRGAVCVAGYSMGGFVAGAVGSLVDHPVGVAALAAGVSPAPVYTRGLLSRQVDWDALGREAGGATQARERLHTFFAQGSAARLPLPRTPQAAVILGCTRDGYVPAEETLGLAARYPGARVRWVNAGHVSAIFTERAALRAAASEALERARAFSRPPEPKRHSVDYTEGR